MNLHTFKWTKPMFLNLLDLYILDSWITLQRKEDQSLQQQKQITFHWETMSNGSEEQSAEKSQWFASRLCWQETYMSENCEVEPHVTPFKCETGPYVTLLQSVSLTSKCEPGQCIVTCFKIQSGTTCYMLWSGKWDCVLLASKTTTLKLGHDTFSSRRQRTRAFRNLRNKVEYRRVSFYARDTFLKNNAQIEHKIPT
jgi:hypothetical protein